MHIQIYTIISIDKVSAKFTVLSYNFEIYEFTNVQARHEMLDYLWVIRSGLNNR